MPKFCWDLNGATIGSAYIFLNVNKESASTSPALVALKEKVVAA
jgi:hypothetical protein